MPKNEELGMLRQAQRSATGPEMRQRAGQKLGEVGKSFGTATDALYNAIRPPEPYRVVGVGKDGQPLYENPLGFGPAVSRQEYDRISGGTDLALGIMPMGGRPRALPLRPSAPSPVRPSLPGNPQPRPSGPGPVAQRTSPQPNPPPQAPMPTPSPKMPAAPTTQAPTPQPTSDPFAGFGGQFTGIDYSQGMGDLAKGYGRSLAKGIGGTALVGSGLAALAGGLSARDPQQQQAQSPVAAPSAETPPYPTLMGAGIAAGAPSAETPPYPTLMGAGIAAGAPYLKDAVGAGMDAIRGLGDPQLPPEPIRASGRDKKRGVPVAQSGSATQAVSNAMQQGQGQSAQQSQAGQQGGGTGPGYWIDMLQAADTGDAYARDLVALREQARAAAIQAAQRGEELQFVPVMDYRGNKMHFVNAGGGDVVLDMNDEQDRAQYQRIVSKTGFAPEQLQQWASRTSAPLMGYFERGGGPRRPDFDPNQRIELPSQVR